MVFAENQYQEGTRDTAWVFPGTALDGFSSGLESLFSQHVLRLPNRCTLLIEGDECRAVYYVRAGWLALSKALEGGQKQIIDFALPGDIVDPSGADGVTASVTVEVLTDGALAAMPYRSWEAMTGEQPALHHLAHRMESAMHARRAERMLRLGRGAAEMRLAYALVEFCIRISPDSDGRNCEFHIPLTQQQLGDYVGLSSVHVCRTLRRMARNGILEMRDHMDIRVLDPRFLACLAGVDVEALKRAIMPQGA